MTIDTRYDIGDLVATKDGENGVIAEIACTNYGLSYHLRGGLWYREDELTEANGNFKAVDAENGNVYSVEDGLVRHYPSTVLAYHTGNLRIYSIKELSKEIGHECVEWTGEDESQLVLLICTHSAAMDFEVGKTYKGVLRAGAVMIIGPKEIWRFDTVDGAQVKDTVYNSTFTILKER